MKLPKATLIALGVALGLGLAYWAWVFKLKPAQEKAKEDAKLLFPGLGADQTSEVLLRKSGSPEVALKRVEGSWRLLKPVQAPADPDALERLIEQLSKAKNDETVVETGAELREFGLDEPSGAVIFKPLSPGAQAQALFFGADNPAGSHAYALVDGKPAVFITPLSLKQAVLLDADGLREKRLWRFEPDDVVSLKAPGFSLQRQAASGGWELSAAGRREPGKIAEINAWLSELAKLRADKVPSEDGRGAFGLGEGKRYEVKLKGGQSLFLTQGKASLDKGLYVQAGGQGPVFQLGEFQAQTLRKTAGDLMDLAAFKFDPFRVERFQIEGGGQTLNAVKKDGAWEWTPAVEAGAFDPMAFCTAFIRVELAQRLSSAQRPKPPWRSISFYAADGQVLERAELGPPEGKSQLAYSEQKALLSRVPVGLLDGLPKVVAKKP